MCAEAVGAMRRVLADTVAYCKQRQQFGQPIGGFQVLQHRMVDMYMELEQSVSAVYLAVLNLDAGRRDRARAVSAAKATIGRAARFIGQERGATARRHGHDRGTGRRALLQAAHRRPVRIRIHRPASHSVRAAQPGLNPGPAGDRKPQVHWRTC